MKKDSSFKPNQRERGIREIYAEDPEKADFELLGRIPEKNRRGFLKGAGLASLATLLGVPIPHADKMPSGLIPEALASDLSNFIIQGKDGLRVLNDRPVNAETPAHLLDDRITPTSRHFIRNNGLPPAQVNADEWTLKIGGEVYRSLEFSIDELKSKFEVVELQLTIECGGNGRSAFNPPAKGNQWSTGAVACSKWTGVRLRDVLKAAGIKESAIYTAHYGADGHLSRKPGKLPISRGVPLEKAMDAHNLIAFAQNGQALHPMNGAPLRLVCPGWPGSTSHKWLTQIHLRDIVHDGPKMTGTSYRVPKYNIAPGTKVPKADFEIIHAMPVKSLITFPKNKVQLPAGSQALQVRGHAWAGDDWVKGMQVSADFGATWIECDLEAPANPYAWQHWQVQVPLAGRGYYEIWARATDNQGKQQPFAINWNPKGYLNNSMHRIAVVVPA